MRRILLTGAKGQVGEELQRSLANLGEVTAVDRQILDLAQPASIRQVISEVQPTCIVNAAAYTAVDKAEMEPDLAIAINAVAPTIMAEEAQRLGIGLIHISTDYVFDGKKNTPYTEQDPTNPVSIYGESKLAGEEGIRKNSDRHIILRTAWVYGNYGKSNFVKTMLRLFAEREEVKVVADQVGTPTWAHDIASAIATIVPQLDDSQQSLTGTYHFTNSGVASWYDLAITILEEAKQQNLPLKVQRLVPITTAEYPTLAKRPAYSVLTWQKISAILGDHPPHWQQALRQMFRELYP